MSIATDIAYRTHIIGDTRTHRIRARRVGCDRHARRAAELAATSKLGRGWSGGHGGSVCNSYGYPADTESCIAVAVTIAGTIHVAIYAAQLPANKVTVGGAIDAALPGARALADCRFGAAARQRVSESVYSAVMRDLAHGDR